MPDESSTPPVADAGAGAAPPAAAPPDAGQQAPWHDGLITKDATGAESLRPYAEWSEKAPAPLREFINANMTAARAKTDGMVRVLTNESTPEEVEAFYKAVGRPDKPEDYGIAKPEKLPDGVEWDEEASKRFAPVAHKLGLTPTQVKALTDWQIEQVGTTTAAARESAQQAIAAEHAQLKKDHGASLPAVCALAQMAAGDAGIPRSVFDPTSGEFWGPQALKLVSGLAAKLSKLGGEDRGSNAGQSTVSGGYEYAKAVTERQHPDWEIYYGRNDNPRFPGIKKAVDDGWRQMPKSGAAV